MTVSSLTTKNSYSGNGSTSAFSYTFKIFDDDDVTVIIRTDSTGTETVKTKTTHYTVSGVGNAGGGTITFTSGNIPASGETVLLLRNTPLTQATDYTPNDPFPAATHEDALDKLTLISQDTQEEIDRSIKLSRANTMTSTEFTVPAATRANKIFAFDGSGELAVTQEIGTFKGDWAASTAYAVRDLVKDTSTNNIFIVNEAHTSSGSQPLTTNANSAKYDLIVDAAAAATSATAAASSATAAASSASTASTQASNASTSASTASTQATNSANSATASASSATAAAASAASAAASFDAFDDIYLGAKSSEPSTDNDGDALNAGDQYFNTTSNTLFVYNGSAFQAATPDIVGDTTPQLGGNLDTNGNDIQFGDSDVASFGADQDLKILHNGNNSFITDSGTGDLYIRGNNNLFIQNADGTANKAQMITGGAVNLMHDGSTKIATASTGVDITGGFTATDGCTITTADNDAQLTLTSTDADAAVGPLLDMIRDSSSPADSDTLGRIRFRGDNDAGEAFTYGTITSKITDASDSTEGGLLTFLVARNGSVTSALDLNETETVFNEGSLDADFRVESNNDTHMLFVDGGTDRLVMALNGGNVMVGTDEPTLFNSEGTSAGLTVAGSDTSTTTIGNGGAAINIVQKNGGAGNTAGLHFSRQDTDGTPNYSGAAIVAQFTDDQAAGEYPKARLIFNTSTNANAAPSEKMRIDSNGDLLINSTSNVGIAKLSIDFSRVTHTGIELKTDGTGATRMLKFRNPNGTVGEIVSETSSTIYATSSDYRLKESVVDMTGAIDRVKALAPKRFNFIADADTTVDGFLAHEAQAVVPEAVTGTHNQVEVWAEPAVDDDDNIIGEPLPDGVSVGDNKLDADGNTIPVYQGIDQSKLVPLLTGALKESIAKIETLETKVAALEAGS